MPFLPGGGKGNEVLYDSAAVINGSPKGMLKLRPKAAPESRRTAAGQREHLQPGTIENECHPCTCAQADHRS
ncbi:terminase small subunit [Escherichia coli]